jgi:hypothetical protein
MVLGSSAAIVNALLRASVSHHEIDTRWHQVPLKLTHLGRLWEKIRSKLKDTKVEDGMLNGREGKDRGLNTRPKGKRKEGQCRFSCNTNPRPPRPSLRPTTSQTMKSRIESVQKWVPDRR